jgi:hypothetical protein
MPISQSLQKPVSVPNILSGTGQFFLGRFAETLAGTGFLFGIYLEIIIVKKNDLWTRLLKRRYSAGGKEK